jgi:hypothetical protein
MVLFAQVHLTERHYFSCSPVLYLLLPIGYLAAGALLCKLNNLSWAAIMVTIIKTGNFKKLFDRLNLAVYPGRISACLLQYLYLVLSY